LQWIGSITEHATRARDVVYLLSDNDCPCAKLRARRMAGLMHAGLGALTPPRPLNAPKGGVSMTRLEMVRDACLEIIDIQYDMA